MTVNSKDSFVFRKACENGDFEMVEILLSMPYNDININSRNDEGFRSAYTNGHIDIIKLLFEIALAN
jgi:ankyrin repeat protein